ncbi:kinase-like domain-containing protein [Xylaria grammica]|nr:kinase-like domain-containing protein [Xylaria grammica]
MQILMGLKGVRQSMACLLLSVAFPETVPYCSEVLFRWTKGTENDDDVSPEEEEEKYYIRMFTRVDEIRRRYGEAVTAIDVEKVAFVMQCNSDMEESRKPEITQTLLGAQRVKGEGGYGTVYEVDPSHFKDIRTNADAIAVKKIMLGENSTDEEALQRRRILTEILVSSQLAGLSDEHFVRFLGWNEDVEEKCYYIAMDWVRYGDLERNLRCPGEPEWKWSETAMKSVVEQILQGLVFMHKERIAHRDLKPQNILVYSLTSPQGEVRIKIADFGVSKRVHTTTIFKTIAGTEGYKAPEVVKAWDDEGHDSDQRYDYNADIWSLGCVIFRMVTGSHLFTADTMVSNDKQLRKKVKSVPKKLRQESSGGIHISESGIKFVEKLIVISAKKRLNTEGAGKALNNWILIEAGSGCRENASMVGSIKKFISRQC